MSSSLVEFSDSYFLNRLFTEDKVLGRLVMDDRTLEDVEAILNNIIKQINNPVYKKNRIPAKERQFAKSLIKMKTQLEGAKEDPIQLSSDLNATFNANDVDKVQDNPKVSGAIKSLIEKCEQLIKLLQCGGSQSPRSQSPVTLKETAPRKTSFSATMPLPKRSSRSPSPVTIMEPDTSPSAFSMLRPNTGNSRGGLRRLQDISNRSASSQSSPSVTFTIVSPGSQNGKRNSGSSSVGYGNHSDFIPPIRKNSLTKLSPKELHKGPFGEDIASYTNQSGSTLQGSLNTLQPEQGLKLITLKIGEETIMAVKQEDLLHVKGADFVKIANILSPDEANTDAFNVLQAEQKANAEKLKALTVSRHENGATHKKVQDDQAKRDNILEQLKNNSINEMRRLRAENDRLNKTSTQATATETELRGKLRGLEVELQGKSKEASTLQSSMTNLERENKKLKDQCSELQISLEEAQRKQRDTQTKLDSNQKQYEKLTQEKSQLEITVKTEKSNLAKTTQQVAALEKEKTKIKEETDTKIQQLQSEAKQKSEEIVKISQESSVKEKKLDDQIKQLRLFNKQKQQMIDTLYSQIGEMQVKEVDLLTTMQQLSKENNQLTALLTDSIAAELSPDEAQALMPAYTKFKANQTLSELANIDSPNGKMANGNHSGEFSTPAKKAS